MTGKSLHDFDLELCSSIRANLRQHRPDGRFQKALTENLAGPLRAYVADDEGEEPGPHERFLLNFEELWDLQHFAASFDGRLTWSVDPAELRRRSVYPIPEIRAHLSAQNAEEWAAGSARFTTVLKSEELPLDEGIATVAEWICEVRWLMRAVGAVALLPYPEGAFPTPTSPTPPLTPPELAVHQVNEDTTPPGHKSELDSSSELAAVMERLAAALEKHGMSDGSRALPTPEALSKEDAATFIGVDVATIEYLIRVKKLEFVQYGSQRGRVIPVASLRKFLDRHRQKTGEDMRRRRSRA